MRLTENLLEEKKKRSKKIRKGDRVIAIAGNYKGHSGTVLSVQNDYVVVQGINVKKKHMKKSEHNPQGAILPIERPMHISNVKLCVDEDKPVRLKVKCNAEGERELFYAKEGADVAYRSIKKQNS